MNAETKICQNCKTGFVIASEDFNFYKKIDVPPPTWCPECRMFRRWVWRNERKLFRRKDAVSGKEIFSSFPRQVNAKVTDLEYWKSDAWDPLDYGRDYDFSRPFFEQFRELLYTVLLPSKSIHQSVNSDYCDQAGYLKNCYLCFNGDKAEDCAYCVNFVGLKDCFDLREAGSSELCYDSILPGSCYKTFFSVNLQNCRDSWFLKDCVGCNDCFGCIGLKNKSYYIWNKPYTKEEYFQKIAELNLGSYKVIADLKQKVKEFWKKYPVKYYHGIHNVNSSGELIWRSKNTKDCYSVGEDCENLRYCQQVYRKCADCYDYSVWGDDASEIYESLTCGEEANQIKFSFDCWPGVRNIEYSAFCRSPANIFGCVGLKKKQHCILNKQYSESEYKALREKIIKHMNEMPYTDKGGRIYRYGEFFPPEFSPFAYNETNCQDYSPLKKEEAIKKGYVWRERELKEYKTTINALDLPDDIKDVSDSIVKEVIECSSCARAYRIIPIELQFLKRINIPVPRLCPECRYIERFYYINPPKFFERKCQCAGETSDNGVFRNAVSHFHGTDHCPNEFKTAYSSKKPEIVYCEECYQKEVV